MEFEFHEQFAAELKMLAESGTKDNVKCALAMYARLDAIRDAGTIVEDIAVTFNDEVLVFVVEAASPGRPMLVYQDGKDPEHPGVVRCLNKVRHSRTELDALAQEVANVLGRTITSSFYPDSGKRK
jgi:hypothetical protein